MTGILDELKVFLKSILWGVALVVVLAFIFFIFPIGPLHHSLTIRVFQKIQRDLMPSGVTLVVTNPLSAFVSEMQLSLLLALIILFPFFLYKILRYLLPALLPHEKSLLLRSVLPASLLFFTGCFVAYRYVIPAVFNILYPYAVTLGAAPFFLLSDFMSLVFSFMIITGIMFLLPVFMVMLSFLGIVPPEFWRTKIRHAIVFFLIFTAVVVPDPTGITMLMLSTLLTLLYLIGYLLTRKFKESKMS